MVGAIDIVVGIMVDPVPTTEAELLGVTIYVYEVLGVKFKSV